MVILLLFLEGDFEGDHKGEQKIYYDLLVDFPDGLEGLRINGFGELIPRVNLGQAAMLPPLGISWK